MKKLIFKLHVSFNFRHMTRRVVWSIVFSGWCLSIGIASMPIYWNTYEPGKCTQDHVLPAQYVNFIITPMFLSIWLAMSVLYMRIWREAAEHAKRLRTAANFPGASAKQRKSLKENKSVQVRHVRHIFIMCDNNTHNIQIVSM